MRWLESGCAGCASHGDVVCTRVSERRKNLTTALILRNLRAEEHKICTHARNFCPDRHSNLNRSCVCHTHVLYSCWHQLTRLGLVFFIISDRDEQSHTLHQQTRSQVSTLHYLPDRGRRI